MIRVLEVWRGTVFDAAHSGMRGDARILKGVMSRCHLRSGHEMKEWKKC